jgi:hypothetical protein
MLSSLATVRTRLNTVLRVAACAAAPLLLLLLLQVGNHQAFLDSLDRERAGQPQGQLHRSRRGSMVAVSLDRLGPSRLHSMAEQHSIAEQRARQL